MRSNNRPQNTELTRYAPLRILCQKHGPYRSASRPNAAATVVFCAGSSTLLCDHRSAIRENEAICAKFFKSKFFLSLQCNSRSCSQAARISRRTEPRNTPNMRKTAARISAFSRLWRISRFSSSLIAASPRCDSVVDFFRVVGWGLPRSASLR